MPKYRVYWTELNHFESEVDAESEEQALEKAINNLGEYQNHDFGGIEQDSIEIVAL